jgi:putative ABC transport system substrate-binding protein
MKKAAVPSILCVVVLLALGVTAEAQQLGKIPRIGVLSPDSANVASDRYDSFRQGLRELGYVEGKNIFIEIRYAEATSTIPLYSRAREIR